MHLSRKNQLIKRQKGRTQISQDFERCRWTDQMKSSKVRTESAMQIWDKFNSTASGAE
jgi:hypothetical protein